MVDYFKDFAVQELCSQVTDGDGLGLANTLYEQMKRNYGIGSGAARGAFRGISMERQPTLFV